MSLHGFRGRADSQEDGTKQLDKDRPTEPIEGTQTPEGTPGNQRDGRSTAELISLAASASIVLGLVVVFTFLYLSSSSGEATIEVLPEFSQIRQESGDYYLPLTIVNQGDVTAEDVIIEASLTASFGQPETSEVTINFLAGHAREDAVVIFSEDPREGSLTFDVISYLDP